MDSTIYTVDVVSPQFPCGAAWLANALLELQVPLPHLWGFETASEWEHENSGRSLYVAEHLPWRQTLASLEFGRSFTFRNGVVPRFSHAFPWQLDFCARVVLIARDPRDALYSEWQRHLRNERPASSVSFLDFLRQPFLGGPISVVDMLWLHLRCWLWMRDSTPSTLLLLRFEDWKRQPVDALDVVTRWIGMPCEFEALRHAAAASDVRRLLDIERTVTSSNPDARQFNRLGEPEEWRNAWLDQWTHALGAHWQPVLHALGYQPLPSTGAAPLMFDIAEVLAWRGMRDTAQVHTWRERCGLEYLP